MTKNKPLLIESECALIVKTSSYSKDILADAIKIMSYTSMWMYD